MRKQIKVQNSTHENLGMNKLNEWIYTYLTSPYLIACGFAFMLFLLAICT